MFQYTHANINTGLYGTSRSSSTVSTGAISQLYHMENRTKRLGEAERCIVLHRLVLFVCYGYGYVTLHRSQLIPTANTMSLTKEGR